MSKNQLWPWVIGLCLIALIACMSKKKARECPAVKPTATIEALPKQQIIAPPVQPKAEKKVSIKELKNIISGNSLDCLTITDIGK